MFKCKKGEIAKNTVAKLDQDLWSPYPGSLNYYQFDNIESVNVLNSVQQLLVFPKIQTNVVGVVVFMPDIFVTCIHSVLLLIKLVKKVEILYIEN